MIIWGSGDTDMIQNKSNQTQNKPWFFSSFPFSCFYLSVYSKSIRLRLHSFNSSIFGLIQDKPQCYTCSHLIYETSVGRDDSATITQVSRNLPSTHLSVEQTMLPLLPEPHLADPVLLQYCQDAGNHRPWKKCSNACAFMSFGLSHQNMVISISALKQLPLYTFLLSKQCSLHSPSWPQVVANARPHHFKGSIE